MTCSVDTTGNTPESNPFRLPSTRGSGNCLRSNSPLGSKSLFAGARLLAGARLFAGACGAVTAKLLALTAVRRPASDCTWRVWTVGLLVFWFGNLAWLGVVTGQIESVELGVGNTLRMGEWAAVTLKLGADPLIAAAARLEVENVDGDGTKVVYDQVPIRQEDRRGTLTGWFRLGAKRSQVLVRLLDGAGNTLAESQVAVDGVSGSGSVQVLPLTTRLIVVAGVSSAARSLFSWGNSRGDGLRLIFVDSLTDLPPTAVGLRNVDTLIVSASTQTTLQGLDAQRRTAIQTWVRGGGRLVFWAAPETSSEFSAGRSFADWIPGSLTGFEPLNSTSRLDFLLKAKQPLIAVGQAGFPVARVESAEGNILIAQENVPLVVRRQEGLGQVTFSALAIDRTPLFEWEGTPRLLDAMVTQVRIGEERAPDIRTGGLGGSYRDLVEQLQVPLEAFAKVSLISFTTVAILIGLLLLLIGPGDYFLLRSLPGRKMEWTWFTFPLTILGFCALAWWLSSRSHPAELQYNQLEVVDVDTVTGQWRGTCWTSIYSPRAETHDIRGKVNEAVPGKLLDEQVSWLALPAGSTGTALGSSQEQYRHWAEASGNDVQVVLQGVPFPVRSTRTLVYQWHGENELPVRSQLRYESGIGRLGGTFTNPFDFPLRNCRIYYEGWAYVFDQPIEAGDTVDLLTEGRERTVKSILTQRDRASAEGKTQNAPWDPRETRFSRLLEMLMFHDSAGGQSYTGFVNRAHGRLEMSDHLELKRAVFMAELPQPTSQLLIDGKPLQEGGDQRFAIVRLSVPVLVTEEAGKSGP